MNKILPLIVFAATIAFASCKKEECAECFTENTDSLGVKDTVSLNELCGEDLESTDGNTFINAQGGTSRSYCNR
jgi:hypothetical protein